MMRLLILLVFIGLPLIEIALLIKVGGIIGVLPTVAIVVLTALAGTFLLRQQGLGVLARAVAAVGEGRMPVEQVVEGAFLIVAGAFLLTPGLITDATGFLLLIPPIRVAVARWTFNRLLKGGLVNVHVFRQGPDGGDPGAGEWPRRGRGETRSGDVIEVEYERVEEDNKRKPGDESARRP